MAAPILGTYPFETKPISGFIVITYISIRSNTACAPHPNSGLIRRFTGLSEKDDATSSGELRNPPGIERVSGE